MRKLSFKTTDGLMRHLRENGISISGSTQKRQLINTGYFHGYKDIDSLKPLINKSLSLIIMMFMLR